MIRHFDGLTAKAIQPWVWCSPCSPRGLAARSCSAWTLPVENTGVLMAETLDYVSCCVTSFLGFGAADWAMRILTQYLFIILTVVIHSTRRFAMRTDRGLSDADNLNLCLFKRLNHLIGRSSICDQGIEFRYWTDSPAGNDAKFAVIDYRNFPLRVLDHRGI